MSQQTIVLPKKFNSSKLSHTPIKDTGNQYSAYAKYDNTDFVFQIPPIRLTDSAIPKKSKFFDTELKRSFIKPQLDSSQFHCVKVSNMLQEVTEWFQSNYQTILGQEEEVYSIIPLVNSDSQCTLKFNVDYGTGKILTSCFMTLNEVRTDIKNPTIDGLCSHLRRGSMFQALVHANKIWYNKQPNKDNIKLAGIKLTLLQLEIIKEYQPKVPIQMRFTEYKMLDTGKQQNEEIEI